MKSLELLLNLENIQLRPKLYILDYEGNFPLDLAAKNVMKNINY